MTDSLFDEGGGQGEARPPLAARMRPRSLDELVGQEQAVGPGTPLRALIDGGELRSAILYGPPGTGKTTIAHIVADRTESPVEKLSAISSGVADVRKVIASAKKFGRTVLFLDEIHRFNRAQQDAFLGAVEDGTIILIGATTENPFFEVNSPLVSRSLLVRLEPLEPSQVRAVLERALDDDRGLGMSADDDALDWIANKCGGDARVALNALEAAGQMARGRDAGAIALVDAEQALSKRVVRYDKSQDRHYDVISAFIKSMRASDVDGALYWLAEMLEGGEDPRFICRRMIIFASEDVGLADPQALVVATSTAYALDHVGLPEAQLNLAQGVIYLATAPKSRAVTDALVAAKQDVGAEAGEVPAHLRDASYSGAARLGHGDGYDKGASKEELAFRPPHAQGRRYWKD